MECFFKKKSTEAFVQNFGNEMKAEVSPGCQAEIKEKLISNSFNGTVALAKRTGGSALSCAYQSCRVTVHVCKLNTSEAKKSLRLLGTSSARLAFSPIQLTVLIAAFILGCMNIVFLRTLSSSFKLNHRLDRYELKLFEGESKTDTKAVAPSCTVEEYDEKKYNILGEELPLELDEETSDLSEAQSNSDVSET
jgi:hypothetical protein